MKQLKTVIEAFIKGGDTSDISLLEKVLHPRFQNIQDGFFDKKGIHIFSKAKYIELINNKTFGGKPRIIDFKSVEKLDNIAIAKVDLESKHLKFHSTIVCVRENGEWQVINNIPKIEVL